MDPELDKLWFNMLAKYVFPALYPSVLELARLLPITSICFELAVRPVVPIEIALPIANSSSYRFVIRFPVF
jgi:hypothetical protein